MSGKGSKPRPTNMKKYVANFPKAIKPVEGFVKVKNKITKKY
jgi:hypothetical protein